MGHGLPIDRSSAQYYMPEMMPLILCCACLAVVLVNSEKATGIYNKIVESYRRPDIREMADKLEKELPSSKNAIAEIHKQSSIYQSTVQLWKEYSGIR